MFCAYVKKFVCTTAVLLLYGAGAVFAAPDSEVQLDTMANAQELWKYDFADLCTPEEMPPYLDSFDPDETQIAVTDLDANGRLELLITWHFLNRDPLYYAGDSISEEQKKGLQYLCETYPSEVYGTAYEISKDGTTLEPYAINHANTQFPDLTRLHIRGKKTDGHYIYMVDTQRMPRDESWTSATDRYGIVYDAQILWADVDLGVGTNAHAEGTASVHGEQVDPFYTSMKLLYLNKDVDPYGEEAAAFERERLDRSGRRVNFVSWEELDKDTRAALAASWQGWAYED